jgi:hypothetical protein
MPSDRACLTGYSLDYKHLMRLLRSLTQWGKNLTKITLLSCNCCRTTSHFGHQICEVCIHCCIDVCFMDSAGLLLVDFLVLRQ